MRFIHTIIFLFLGLVQVVAQDPYISGPAVSRPGQRIAFRNFNMPPDALSGGTWTVHGGSIYSNYNGGTFTSILMDAPAAGISLRVEFKYRDLGTDIEYTYSWRTIIRDTLKAGAIVSPTSTISVPSGQLSTGVTATEASGGFGVSGYVWQQSVNGGAWTNVDCTARDLPEQVVTANMQFRRGYKCRYTNLNTGVDFEEIVYTAPVQFNVLPALLSGAITPTTQTLVYGANTSTLNGAASSGGSCGSYSYQWQESYDNIVFNNIAGGTALNYTPGIAAERKYYRRVTTCGGYSVVSNTALVLLQAFSAANPVDENYVRTYNINQPGALTFAQAMSVPATGKFEKTVYVDGIGREIQKVETGFSPTGKDVVSPSVYDDGGRQATLYGSYTTSVSAGKIKANPVTDLNSFMGGIFPGEGNFQTTQLFEASPDNLVEKTMAPGNAWGGRNRGILSQSGGQLATDAVRIWTVAGAVNVIPSTTAVYPSGVLTKSVATNEHGRQVIKYIDKNGRVILSKVQIDLVPTVHHDGWLCTYYIYDELGFLRYVVPPAATDRLKVTAWSMSDTALVNGLCFKYEYDTRGRTILKKVPGADVIEYVYDVRDRLVFERDGKLKLSQQWKVTFYDVLDRPVHLALFNSTADRATLQTQMNNATGTSVINTLVEAPEELIVAERVAGIPQYVAKKDINFVNGFDSDVAAFDAFIDPNAASSVVTIQASNPYPSIDPAKLYSLSYHYYDTYEASLPAFNIAIMSSLESGASTVPEVVSNYSKWTAGVMTGSKIRVLGTNSWNSHAVYYDMKGRSIQAISTNLNGGTDIVASRYDFNGRKLSDYYKVNNPLSTQDAQLNVLTVNKYDFAGRLTAIEKVVNSGARKTISTRQYDELGNLKQNNLGSSLESLAYEYNVRGWLKGINKPYAMAGGTNYFGTVLHFNDGVADSLFDGNISSISWRSKSDEAWRLYDFAYDPSGRLKGADFRQHNGSAWAKHTTIDFTVNNLTYDANGNILSMTQKGMKGGSSPVIDQLTYTYAANSNRLTKVTDAANDPLSVLGDFKDANSASTTDYVYDANGNLAGDQNKDISKIEYNHLNLPALVHMKGKGTISYLYDADGLKLRKTVVDSTINPVRKTTTDYLPGGVYQNDTLLHMAHEEGRFRPVQPSGQPRSYVFDYFVKDHLGNVRVVLTEETQSQLYMATMEPEKATAETALFDNVDATRSAKPVGYPDEGQAAQNTAVAKLNAKDPNKRIGPSLVLKVMAGDTVKIGAKAFYKTEAASRKQKVTAPVEDLAGALINAFGNPGAALAAHHNSVTQGRGAVSGDRLPEGTLARMREKELQDPTHPDRPKAYLNFALFDEQFNLVEENSGVKQVAIQPDELQTLAPGEMVVKKSGFLYVYTSNETQQDVFFDNLTVALATGPVLEETHYYPFGLTMAGISEKALYNPENRFKYNGIEKIGDLGLEDYDAKFRELDPQIGRWWQVDPKIENMEMWSPYASNYDNPIRFSDFLGDEPGDWWGRLKTAAYETVGQIASAAAGAANAYTTNNLAGVGRIDVESTGLTGGYAIAYQVGQKLGDAAAVITGSGEVVGSGAGEYLTAGIATPVAVPVAIHGTVTAGVAAKNLFAPIKYIEGGSSSQTPTVQEQAQKVKNDHNGGRNSVTIKTNKGQSRYDLDGAPHGGVPTPHRQDYKKNIVDGIVKSMSRTSKEAQAMTKEEVRLVRKYLENLKKRAND